MRVRRQVAGFALVAVAAGGFAVAAWSVRGRIFPARPNDPQAASLVAGNARAPLAPPPLAFPELLARETPPRPGAAGVLSGRPVRTDERPTLSPFAAWMRRVQTLRSSAGPEVVVWTTGARKPPAPEPAVILLPHKGVRSDVRSWLLTTTAGERTTVLALHDSPRLFERDDYDCTDTTNLVGIVEVSTSPSTLWIELDQRWSCRFNGAHVPSHPAPPPDDAPHEVDRKVGVAVAVEADGSLHRLMAVALRERDADGSGTTLVPTFTDGALELRPGPGMPPPSQEQQRWVGIHAFAPLRQQATAVPTWLDQPSPGEAVPTTCAPAGDAPKLVIEADAPVTRELWAPNPDVTLLRVPYLTERVRIRPIVQAAGGTRMDASDDPCLRLQLVGSGLSPTPERLVFEPLPRPESVEGASLIALYRGQRVVVRFELAPALGPTLPAAAAALLARQFRGFYLPDRQRCPGWNFFANGPGLAVVDLNRDGRADVAAVLLDDQRWRLVILTLAAAGEYQVAFDEGAAWKPRAEGDPIEEVAMRATGDGDVEIDAYRVLGGGRESWLARWTGATFERMVRSAPAGIDVARGERPARIPGLAELEDAFRARSFDETRKAIFSLHELARSRPRTPETDALLAAVVPTVAGILPSASSDALRPIDPTVAVEAIALLERIGAQAAPAAPALEVALRSPSCTARVAARRALAAVRGRPYASDPHRDATIECQGGYLPAPGRGTEGESASTSAPGLPRNSLVVRALEPDRATSRFGFRSPVELDWRALARGRIQDLDVDAGTGPALEAAGKSDDQMAVLTFVAPVPPDLQRAHYYLVSMEGVVPFTPPRLLGEARVTPDGVAGYDGVIEAAASDRGFVIISDAALDFALSDSSEIDRLWRTAVAEPERRAVVDDLGVAFHPRALAFQLMRGRAFEQYLYALLPPDRMCQDRRQLVRITGAVAELVAEIATRCD